MNILHHKSWHVRTKQNIERVRKDEEKAANEEKERQRKIALAEQEARTDLLRKRAKLRVGDGDQTDEPAEKKPCLSDPASNSKSVDIYTNSGNINFFKDIESGEKKSGKNAENEADKKAEKEKWEKDIGLLTYLGQSAVEAQEHKPWYLNKRSEETETDKVDSKMMKQKKEIGRMDPLEEMNSYLHKKKHKHKDKKKHKDHKQKHKKKSKEREIVKSSSIASSSKSIEQLRAERLKREQEERRRTEALLLGDKGQGSEFADEPLDERKRGYNSVFNPELVRKRRPRKAYDDY